MVKVSLFTKKFLVYFIFFSNFSLLVLSNTVSDSVKVEKDAPTFYDIVAAENLKSFTQIGDDGSGGLCAGFNKMIDQGFEAYLKDEFQKQINPSPEVKRRLIFSLLSRHAKSNPVIQTNVLDLGSWKDLELLCGPKSDASFYLASRVKRTITGMGDVIFCCKIIEPKVKAKDLLDQQEIVKELVSNEACFNKLDEKLKELVLPENLFLSFWNTEDFLTLMLQQNRIKIPLDDKVAAFKNISEWLNKSPVIVQSRSSFRSCFGNVSDLLAIYGAVALPVYMFTGKSIIPFLPAEGFRKVAPYTTWGAVCWLLNMASSKNWISSTLSSNVTSGVATYKTIEEAYYDIKDRNVSDCVHSCYYKKIHGLAKFLNNLKDMAQLVAQNKSLAEHFTALSNFNENLELLEAKSKDLKQLLNILDSQTFKKDEAGYFQYFGKTLVAYKLMLDLKDSFLDVMVAVGEIDAQLSIAKLYKEFEHKRVKFCFPKFITGSTLPSVKVVDFWNPFIDAEKVVENSLVIGSNFGQAQNVIITGPNAAGKSTITKGLVISIILAQSLGIAPASDLEFSPFSKIVAYLNIVDDIAAGNSLFKAGALRARYLVETVYGLGTNELSLIVIDEIFNGTSFKEAQAAAYSLIKHLGDSPKSICLANTHFPLVTKLENETGKFINYKVYVEEDALGKITCPFKLIRGISNQVITLKFLKQEGLGDQFLQEAQRVLDA